MNILKMIVIAFFVLTISGCVEKIEAEAKLSKIREDINTLQAAKKAGAIKDEATLSKINELEKNLESIESDWHSIRSSTVFYQMELENGKAEEDLKPFAVEIQIDSLHLIELINKTLTSSQSLISVDPSLMMIYKNP